MTRPVLLAAAVDHLAAARWRFASVDIDEDSDPPEPPIPVPRPGDEAAPDEPAKAPQAPSPNELARFFA
ncbi:hypothetical protein [Streptomyces qinglanensis]|uniref:hypothetical protein n=1 Tax=Streptomyces qinglanensis TaxID=943816 RepID=UPI003D745299